jgi:hypothetical protein
LCNGGGCIATGGSWPILWSIDMSDNRNEDAPETLVRFDESDNIIILHDGKEYLYLGGAVDCMLMEKPCE